MSTHITPQLNWPPQWAIDGCQRGLDSFFGCAQCALHLLPVVFFASVLFAQIGQRLVLALDVQRRPLQQAAKVSAFVL